MDINHCQTHRATHQPLCHRPLMPPIHLWVHQQSRQLPFPHRERWAFPTQPPLRHRPSRQLGWSLFLWLLLILLVVRPCLHWCYGCFRLYLFIPSEYHLQRVLYHMQQLWLVAREPILVKLLPRLNDFKAALLPALKPSRPAIVAAAPALTVFDPWYATLAVLSTVLFTIAVSLPFDNVRCLYN